MHFALSQRSLTVSHMCNTYTAEVHSYALTIVKASMGCSTMQWHNPPPPANAIGPHEGSRHNIWHKLATPATWFYTTTMLPPWPTMEMQSRQLA